MKRKFTLFAMCVLCQTLGPSCRCLCLNYHGKNQETLRSRRRRTLHKFSIIYIFDTRLIGPNAQVIFKQLLGLNDNKSRKRLICFSKHIMNMHLQKFIIFSLDKRRIYIYAYKELYVLLKTENIFASTNHINFPAVMSYTSLYMGIDSFKL